MFIVVIAQGWDGERHNRHLDVGRDLLGGDALWQGGGGGVGGHTGCSFSQNYLKQAKAYSRAI